MEVCSSKMLVPYVLNNEPVVKQWYVWGRKVAKLKVKLNKGCQVLGLRSHSRVPKKCVSLEQFDIVGTT